MEKSLPRGINYSDIKPEAIESMIKVVRFTPTATVNTAKANDIIRFQLQGAGFYDPYSAYIKIEVACNLNDFVPTDAAPFCGRFLDRSAHSLIGRLVIKSQGTELERIEQYDILAAMLNDMLYSEEQAIVHHYEGMGTGHIDAFPSGGTFLQQANFLPEIFLQQVGQDTIMRYLGEPGFWNHRITAGTILNVTIPSMIGGVANNPEVFDSPSVTGFLFQPVNIGAPGPFPPGWNSSTFMTFNQLLQAIGFFGGALNAKQTVVNSSPQTLTFCIPIYSGLLGVLMTDKKMIPMSLMPLEVEFTLNPYAFYDVGPEITVANPRDYTVNKFWIYSHMLFFEQELHRSLESVVAENGIFIHFNSFYLAPITTHVNNTVTAYAQINIHAKSINSVHFVFIYTGFEKTTGVRKLHFSNHNLEYLQIRNGTELTPNEPITGFQSTQKNQNQHIQFLLETYKAYNKMHDPTTDGAIGPFSYCTDMQMTRPQTCLEMLMKQAQLGRCQYAVSLEGEELGQDKQIISGRKGLVPFDINMQGSTKTNNVTSFQFVFVRADYIVYVRPDLVVTLLGR